MPAQFTRARRSHPPICFHLGGDIGSNILVNATKDFAKNDAITWFSFFFYMLVNVCARMTWMWSRGLQFESMTPMTPVWLRLSKYGWQPSSDSCLTCLAHANGLRMPCTNRKMGCRLAWRPKLYKSWESFSKRKKIQINLSVISRNACAVLLGLTWFAWIFYCMVIEIQNIF